MNLDSLNDVIDLYGLYLGSQIKPNIENFSNFLEFILTLKGIKRGYYESATTLKESLKIIRLINIANRFNRFFNVRDLSGKDYTSIHFILLHNDDVQFRNTDEYSWELTGRLLGYDSCTGLDFTIPNTFAVNYDLLLTNKRILDLLKCKKMTKITVMSYICNKERHNIEYAKNLMSKMNNYFFKLNLGTIEINYKIR
jgi:hypothetical protein